MDKCNNIHEYHFFLDFSLWKGFHSLHSFDCGDKTTYIYVDMTLTALPCQGELQGNMTLKYDISALLWYDSNALPERVAGKYDLKIWH